MSLGAPSRQRRAGAGGGGGGSAIEALDDLRLWIDAADSPKITLSGSDVTGVTSKDPNARAFTAVGAITVASEALNGVNTLSMDGGYLQSDDAKSVWGWMHQTSEIVTVWAVARPYKSAPSGTNYACLLGTFGNAGAGATWDGVSIQHYDKTTFTAYRNAMQAAAIQNNNGVFLQSTQNFWSSTTYRLTEVSWNVATQDLSMQVDAGTPQTFSMNTGTNSDDPNQTLRIGTGWSTVARWPWIGNIGELVIARGAVTSGQRTAVRAELAAKWGVTA